jgi:hypothetical protein
MRGSTVPAGLQTLSMELWQRSFGRQRLLVNGFIDPPMEQGAGSRERGAGSTERRDVPSNAAHHDRSVSGIRTTRHFPPSDPYGLSVTRVAS